MIRWWKRSSRSHKNFDWKEFMAIYKQLNHDPINKYLKNDEIEKIEKITKREIYNDQESIIALGNRNRDLIKIIKGVCVVSIVNSEGKEIIVAELPEGEIVGDQNFIIPVRRSANVRARNKVVIMRYPYLEMIDLLRKEPEISTKVFAAINDSLSEKLVRTIEKYLEKSVRN